ncbi:MAG TPA: caspase family protein, partial [Acetobacteraceae bacterium]
MTSRGCRTIGPVAAICLALVAAGSARAEPAPGRLALVFGQSAYANMPPVPGCAASAQAVANRLQQLGFDVISQIDASNGAMSAALSDFAHRKTLATDPRVVVYVCARAAGFENRVFLLPVTASVTRPSDVLTEGIPAQSIIDLAGQNTAVSLTVLDTFGTEDPDAFAKRQHLAPGHFLVVAVEPTIGTTATPLSQAL